MPGSSSPGPAATMPARRLLLLGLLLLLQLPPALCQQGECLASPGNRHGRGRKVCRALGEGELLVGDKGQLWEKLLGREDTSQVLPEL